MRERVETGTGMLVMFGLGGLVVWWWHSHTSATSLWWTVTLVAAIACAIGIGRGAQLFLSGFSGFGRNFHEAREPPEEDATVDSETAAPLLPPTVLMISGIIVVLLKLFPALNSAQEFSPDHFVSPRVLVPWMFFVGLVTAVWSTALLVMMKTGTDRWAHVPGTRDEIGKVSKIYLALGVLLVAIASAFAISDGRAHSDDDAHGPRIVARVAARAERAVGPAPRDVVGGESASGMDDDAP